MLTQVAMYFRGLRERLNGGKARRAAEWAAACEKAEREHLNRSDGAKRGWERRRAKANGVAGAALREDAGGSSTAETPALQPSTDDDALARQRIDAGWLDDFEEDAIRSTGYQG